MLNEKLFKEFLSKPSIANSKYSLTRDYAKEHDY